MQIYLRPKDERIWQMVVRGFTATDGTTGPKSEDTWDDNDLNRSNGITRLSMKERTLSKTQKFSG